MRSFLEKVQKRYIVATRQITEQEFYERNKLDPERFSYAGSGDFGEAYYVGDHKVLKKTSSRSEFRIAKEIMQGGYPAFVKIYDVEEITNPHNYFILQEEVDVDSDIEDTFIRFNSMLETQQVPLSYMSHFDEDEYIESGGDEVVKGKIDQEILDFMAEIEDIVRDYKKLGIEAVDIHPANLGRNKQGKLIAFDVDEKGHGGHWH